MRKKYLKANGVVEKKIICRWKGSGSGKKT